MRSRCSASRPPSRPSIIDSFVGSSLSHRVNSRPSWALLPMMSGTGWAVPRPHRLDRVERQVVGAAGRADGEGAEHAALGILDQLVERVHQLGRAWRPAPPATASFRSTPSRAANCVGIFRPNVGGAHHTAGRALRNRLCEKPFRCGHREQCGDGLCARALAEDRHVVRVAAEHRDVVAHPAQTPSQGPAGTGCPRW